MAKHGNKPGIRFGTTDQRLQEVLRMLVAGYTSHEMYQYSLGAAATEDQPARKPWNVAERAIRGYCSRARKVLAREAAHNRRAEFGKASRRLDLLYRRAMANGDNAAALAAERERIKLFGLAEPERQAVDVTSGGQPLRTEIAFSVAPGSGDDA